MRDLIFKMAADSVYILQNFMIFTY